MASDVSGWVARLRGAEGWYASRMPARWVDEPEGVMRGVGAAVGSGVSTVGCTRAKP